MVRLWSVVRWKAFAQGLHRHMSFFPIFPFFCFFIRIHAIWPKPKGSMTMFYFGCTLTTKTTAGQTYALWNVVICFFPTIRSLHWSLFFDLVLYDWPPSLLSFSRSCSIRFEHHFPFLFWFNETFHSHFFESPSWPKRWTWYSTGCFILIQSRLFWPTLTWLQVIKVMTASFPSLSSSLL